MIEDYIVKRTQICHHCPIYDMDNEMCNAHLYLNPNNNDVSVDPKEGYIKGCGCHLKFKIKNRKSFCPAHRWEAES